MNSFIFLRNKPLWLLLLVSKTKIIYLTSCCIFVVVKKEDKKNRFLASQVRRLLEHIKSGTSLENNKVLNAWSVFFEPISGTAGRKEGSCKCYKTVKR